MARNDPSGVASAVYVNSSSKVVINSGGDVLVGSASLTNSVWSFVCATSQTLAGMTIYINGSPDATTVGGSAATILWNHITQFGGDQFMANIGKIDEFRTSTATLPAGQILADFNSQKSAATFLTVGAES